MAAEMARVEAETARVKAVQARAEVVRVVAEVGPMVEEVEANELAGEVVCMVGPEGVLMVADPEVASWERAGMREGASAVA